MSPIFYFSAIGTAFAGVCFLKHVMSGEIYYEPFDATGKVYVITGANSGLGELLTHHLALKKATVYMACRDLRKCEEARKDIVLHTRNRYVYCRQCDLSSFESIKNFVNKFKTEQDRLDGLINNAGVMECPKSFTKEGIEMHLGVNHMGHFLLTNLLLDVLKKSTPSRVVIVTGDAHQHGKIKLDDLNMEHDYNPTAAYNQSKLANLLFMNELSSQLIETGVTVNAVNPGTTSTNLRRHMSVSKSIARFVIDPLFWPFVKAPERGVQTILYTVLEPRLEKVTGKYFNNMKDDVMSEDSKNVELAKWLWEVSTRWTKITE